MCQGFNHFSSLLLHFVLEKSANSSIRVERLKARMGYSQQRATVKGNVLPFSEVIIATYRQVPFCKMA